MTSSALVVGASRGIGRQIAITLSNNGFNVGIAAKTVEHSAKLPGTIYSVADEIHQKTNRRALPLQCNVRDVTQIQKAVQSCIDEFGKLDLLVYNAGAILWEKVVDTPLKRFQVMMEVNVGGAYAAVESVLPHMLQQKTGRIILVAPPIYNRFFKGKTPYAITKIGMTVLVHGLSNELAGTGVSVSALWPATVIESHVTAVRNVPAGVMRTAEVFADACLAIAGEKSEKYNGKALIDEDLLRGTGVTDFKKYRCDPNVEPPRMMPKVFPSLLVEEENEQLQWPSKL